MMREDAGGYLARAIYPPQLPSRPARFSATRNLSAKIVLGRRQQSRALDEDHAAYWFKNESYSEPKPGRDCFGGYSDDADKSGFARH
jgi:hypothetical protein